MRLTTLRGFVLTIVMLFAMKAESDVRIRYGLAMPRPATHLFEVTVTFSGLPAAETSNLKSISTQAYGCFVLSPRSTGLSGAMKSSISGFANSAATS